MAAVVQTLFVLPTSVATAAENMALDWLLLESFPEPESVRLRYYGWANPAWTFGYGQKWAEAHAASDPTAELIRRPTGGGLVNHRHDWTYALVIPASHPLTQARACDCYRAVHEALSTALTATGVDNHLQATCPPAVKNKFSVCFHQPERFDLVRTDSGQKIAGAGQKRTRQGILLQGTVDRNIAVEVTDWEKFGARFSQSLATVIKLEIHSWVQSSWPDPVVKSKSVNQFSSSDWNQRR